MRCWPLLMICVACRDAGPSTDTQLNEMAQALGCDPSLDVFETVQIQSTATPSVVQLSWESSEPVQARLVSDVGREDYLESPWSEPDLMEDEELVLGVPYQRDVHTMVVAETPNGIACSEPIHGDATLLDEGVPELSASRIDSSLAAGGFTALGLITEGATFAIVVDEYGEVVWNQATGLGVVSRVVFAQDEAALLYMTWAERLDEKGTIVRMGMDGEVQETVGLTAAHTDFVELPDGGMAAIGWDLREYTDDNGNLRRILGDHIVEVDADGTERVIWSVFDAYEPDLSLQYEPATVGLDDDLEDWSHGNGLTYDAEADDYLISLFGLGSLIRVDRATGQTVWRLSDSHGDFVSTTDELLIQGTHSVESLEDNRLLLFNRNIANPLDEPIDDISEVCSEAVEIQLDTDQGEATKLWSYASDECVLVVYFGEAVRLDNGNTMVIFSSSGQISETTPEGQTVWQLNADVGGAFGFGGRRSSLY